MAFALVLTMEDYGPAQDEGGRPLGRKTSTGRRAHEALPEPRSRSALAGFVLGLGTCREERTCWPRSLQGSSGSQVTTGLN